MDDYCNFDWKIYPDKKIVQGYQSQKATMRFRGRDWQAWFSTEISISDGPWKFCGLPGLILEISDTQEYYVFTCTGLENKKIAIVMYDWMYEKATREKVRDYLIKFHKSPYGFIPSHVVFDGISKEDIKKMSFPYNPLELE